MPRYYFLLPRAEAISDYSFITLSLWSLFFCYCGFPLTSWKTWLYIKIYYIYHLHVYWDSFHNNLVDYDVRAPSPQLFFCLIFTIRAKSKGSLWGNLQDGGGVRHGDHLPPHKYNKNTSTCGATPTEHLLNADRRPQTSKKARKSPHTWVGRKKKEKKNRDRTCTPGRELWRRKSFHTLGSPFTGRDRVRGASEPQRRAQQQGCRGQSGEIPTQRIGANQHSPAWDACLLTCCGEWGLGAEARASEVRPQEEDWSWLHEDSLKGASVPQLTRRGIQQKVWTC